MGTWKFAYLAFGVPKENTHFTVGFGIAVEELQVVIIQKKKGTEASTSLQQRYYIKRRLLMLPFILRWLMTGSV